MTRHKNLVGQVVSMLEVTHGLELPKALQLRELDHIIVGDNSHFSFFDEGLITQYEDSFLTLRRRATA